MAVAITQQTIANLEAQTKQSQKFSPNVSEGGEAGIARQRGVEQLQTVDELKAKLVKVLPKCDRNSPQSRSTSAF